MFKDFDSLEERNRNSATVVRKTRDFVSRKCVETLDSYEYLVSKILEIKASPRPTLRKNTLESLENGNIPCQKHGSRNKTPEETRLWLILNAIEDNKYYIKPPEPGTLRLQNISILTTLTAKPAWGPDLFATALSDYYIPRLVTVACIILIALETGWNADAIYSLTSQDIVRTRTGYQLIGLKGRGNQQQNATVVDPDLKPPKNAEVEAFSDEDDESDIDKDKYASHPATVRAIDLLLKNLEQIKRHTGIETSRVFLSLNLKKKSPNMFIDTIYDEALSDFCKHNHFPNLSLKDIRDIAAHHWYLCPDGSVYQVNVFLNHKDLTTTSIYLHSTILESLYDANILRYMKKLSASIIFSCGRKDILESKITLKDHVDEDLLFPVSPMQPESDKSRVDKWLDANGEINVKIGRNEIHHCASQYLHYRNGFDEMANSNPERFVRYHLPRIVTCIALRNVILMSTHAAILTDYEEKLHAPSPIASNKLHW
ncbi:hypothetical protein PQR75_05330 [Paraburkholderia fungorum]|uniref:hypothetical protein n=1 Tax=Paraburkholderia fungorum TaxID=134537 RepID=UPI0038B863C0